MSKKKQELKSETALNNSLTSLITNLYNYGAVQPYGGAQLSQTDSLYYNLRWYLVSNQRNVLNQLYVEHGIIQTLIDQPVDDAFRSGFVIKSEELSPDDIEQLEIYVERNRVIENLIQAMKWARLFGGGAVMIVTDQNPKIPLDIDAITKDTPIEFKAVDMWELYQHKAPVEGEAEVTLDDDDEFYNYYGKPVHKSRVYRINGKEAPSMIRPRLRGWGMSEVERVIRSVNQYLKNQDVVFELLDEAKIDVYRISGFNSALMTQQGTNGVTTRVQLGNHLKNYNNALTMDKEDEYEQKQISFAGLSEILTQIRQGIAADLKMPVTKLFGISASGFNSGEDDIENYNSMIESEIRSKCKFMVVDLLSICCQKVFGSIPDDLMIKFNPLRILSAKEEEEVKTDQFNRVMNSYQSGLISAQEAKEGINKNSLLPVEVDEQAEALPPINGDFTDESMSL